MTDSKLNILNKTKGKLPSLPFEEMKNYVLGAEYDLSLVFAGDTLSRSLNKKYRNKDKPTNILSFPLGSVSGEIFINLGKAKKEAKTAGRKIEDYLAFLLIHGLVHLKGFDHGPEMEKSEEKIRSVFKVSGNNA